MPQQERSLKDRPLQYRRGWVEFYRLRLKVTADVLIPRPETELLVDEVLKSTKTSLNSLILDIGTGAGNIAISLAKNLPTWKVGKIIATDISQRALIVAKLNAKYHGVLDRIEFIQSDLLERVSDTLVIRDSDAPLVIVTNLPYIPSPRIPYLDSSVKDYEPHIALDGGKDGFELYRKLFQQLQKLTHKRGRLTCLIIGEIDYTHGELAVTEGLKYFPQARIEVKTDLAHKQRILIIKICTFY